MSKIINLLRKKEGGIFISIKTNQKKREEIEHEKYLKECTFMNN